MSMKKKGIVIGIALFMVLYCAAYLVLRSQHVIMHFSNADDPDPEKRSPWHFVGATSDESISHTVVNIVFFPAILAEQIFRNIKG